MGLVYSFKAKTHSGSQFCRTALRSARYVHHLALSNERSAIRYTSYLPDRGDFAVCQIPDGSN